MPDDPRLYSLQERLYDTYAHRLHAYCRALIGDDAPITVREVFHAALRLGPPPDGDTAMWLYRLARAQCARHAPAPLSAPIQVSAAISPRRATAGASSARRGRHHSAGRSPDPLDRAAATLRPDQREVLVLAGGGWLEDREIARLLGIAPDTVAELMRTGRTKLERGVVDILLTGTGHPEQEELIAAFEKGTLAALLARRIGTAPPAELRASVLAAVSRPARPARPPRTGAGRTHPGHPGIDPVTGAWTITGDPDPQLVRIEPPAEGEPDPVAHRRKRRLPVVAGLAASAAVAACLVTGLTVRNDGLLADGRRWLTPSGSDTPARRHTPSRDRAGAERIRAGGSRASAPATPVRKPPERTPTPSGVLPGPKVPPWIVASSPAPGRAVLPAGTIPPVAPRRPALPSGLPAVASPSAGSPKNPPPSPEPPSPPPSP